MRHHRHYECVPAIFRLGDLWGFLPPFIQQDLEKDRKGHGEAKNAIFLQKVWEFLMMSHEKCWGYNRKQSRFKTAPTNITVDLYRWVWPHRKRYVSIGLNVNSMGQKFKTIT